MPFIVAGKSGHVMRQHRRDGWATAIEALASAGQVQPI